MKFSYNWLKEYLPKIPKAQKLAEILTLHSFEVKEVIRKGGDFVLDIDVLPNRGSDCFSHWGIAREIPALIKDKFQIPKYKIQNTKYKSKDFVRVEVKNKEACPRYTARVVTDIKVGPSPKFIQERLKVCGLRPINNVVDIANYVMLETGQPLHAFDFAKLEGVNPKFQIKKLIVRFANNGEKITTLDEEKYDLDENILVIADAKKPVAIAGIKGGKDTGIDKKTKIVVLESANFNPRVIRRGSQKLDLKTDASLRFEHGIDQNLTEIAINRAAHLMAKIAGAKVAQGIVDFYPQKILPKRVRLDLDYLERLLGMRIPEREIRKILGNLGFKVFHTKYKIQNTKYFLVEVPTFRLDINIPEDLIEEIGRIYGYEKIPADFPQAILVSPKRNLERFWENIIRDSLKETGFLEVYNYSFISEKLKDVFGYQAKEVIEIENPVSKESKYLRPSLIPNLLRNASDNLRFFDEIKIFELGKIFIKKQEARSKEPAFAKASAGKQIIEKIMLAGLIVKKESKEAEGFYQLKGVIDSLLNGMGISNIWYAEPRSELCSTTVDDYKPTWGPDESRGWRRGDWSPEASKISIWQEKKSAEIKIDHQEIGFLGAISPKILESFKITIPVFLFELDFDKLSQLASEEHEFRPISRYPAAVRDIAVLVPQEIRAEEVLNKIEIAGGQLLRDVDLFDIYEGEELPKSKKNLAFHLIFQAEDRTLSSREIDEIQNKIIKALEEEPEWQVRK